MACLCAHNPKIEFALAITSEVELLRTNCISITTIFTSLVSIYVLAKEQVPGTRTVSDRVPEHRSVHKDKVKMMIKECFPQFGLAFDGLPLFDEAKCVVIRLVHKRTWNIVELIIHLALYAISLDSEAIAKYICDAMAEYSLDGRFWCVDMLDRAATNKGSLALVEQKKGWNTLSAWCISHDYAGCEKTQNEPGETGAETVYKNSAAQILQSPHIVL